MQISFVLLQMLLERINTNGLGRGWKSERIYLAIHYVNNLSVYESVSNIYEGKTLGEHLLL